MAYMYNRMEYMYEAEAGSYRRATVPLSSRLPSGQTDSGRAS